MPFTICMNFEHVFVALITVIEVMTVSKYESNRIRLKFKGTEDITQKVSSRGDDWEKSE